MIQTIPNSQSWGDLDSLINFVRIHQKKINGEYLLTGLENTKKNGLDFLNLPATIELMDRYAYYIMTVPKKVSKIKNALLPKEWIDAGMPSQFAD